MYSYIEKSVFNDNLGSRIESSYKQNHVIMTSVNKRLRCKTPLDSFKIMK